MAISDGPLGRWLRSRRNIAGCLGALVAVVLGTAGVLPAPWWPLAVVALYGAGALALPGPPGGPGGRGDERVDVARLRSALATHRRRAAQELTGGTRQDVLAVLDRLAGTLGQLFDRPDLLHRGAPETFVIERMVDDYLPTALDAYLRLPAAFADAGALSDGRTALQVLLAQLELLETAAREATEAASRDQADRLLAHGRFLAERFGPQPSQLDLSGTAPTAPRPPGRSHQGKPSRPGRRQRPTA